MRQIQDDRDLFQPIAVPVMQDQHRPFARRQLLDQLTKADVRRRRPPGQERRKQLTQMLHAPMPAETEIHGDSRDPRLERRPVAQLVEAPLS